jgi:hypothetical protein
MAKRVDEDCPIRSIHLKNPLEHLEGGFVLRDGVERSCEGGATDPARDGALFIVRPFPTVPEEPPTQNG